MKYTVVIGAGFGDEGKGNITDYFAQKNTDLVVRFSGGANAAHTVRHDNIEHIFGHFGSGTLSGVPTFLGKEFIVNPTLFMKEWRELNLKGITPKVDVHKDCKISTIYDMLINQMIESKRGNKRHGSCGVGINETIVRNNNLYGDWKLSIWDLHTSYAGEAIDNIRKKYMYARLLELGFTEEEIKKESRIMDPEIFKRQMRDIKDFYERMNITNKHSWTSSAVFEGSQGLSLDAESKYFPYVTNARTGLTNIVDTLRNARASNVEIEVVYVSRVYSTRHGAGPLPMELPQTIGEDKTNVPNPWQGQIRHGILDLDEVRANIVKDLLQVKDLSILVSMAFTCVDQISDSRTLKIVSNGFMSDFTGYTPDRFKREFSSILFDTIPEVDKIYFCSSPYTALPGTMPTATIVERQ